MFLLVTLVGINNLFKIFRQSASFNKEVFVDFMGAQIKTLAFLAYIIRIYQETIANHANLMVKGIIGLLTLCPPEVAHLRKELVIATRHILATDLRLSKSFIFKAFTDQESNVICLILCISFLLTLAKINIFKIFDYVIKSYI